MTEENGGGVADGFCETGAEVFAELGEVSPADDALLDRLVDGAIAPVAPSSPAQPTGTEAASSGVGLKLGGAALVLGSVVASVLWLRRAPEPPPADKLAAAPTEVQTRSVPPPAETTQVAPLAAPPVEPIEPAAANERATRAPDPAKTEKPGGKGSAQTVKSTKSTKPTKTQASGFDDPASLLVAANRAGRAKQYDRAEQLYRALAREFPSSREHRISHVALGDLQLDVRGRAKPALTEYEAYLRAKPKGNLAEEALYGKARALGSLHRDGPAAKAWAQLLERFPSSLHAAEANKHIAGE